MNFAAASVLESGFFKGRRVLVTGGAGFIGSHLTTALVEAGAVVRVYDDGSTGDWENLASIEGGYERVDGSVLDGRGLQHAVEGVQTVFHLAAVCSVPGSVADPGKYHLVNTTGTTLALEASRQAGVERFVFTSSSAVYGESEVLPKTESLAVEPLSPYAASKASGEAMVRAYAGSYDRIDGVSLRYFNVYGPKQNANSAYAAVIAAFAQAYGQGKAPMIFGDGGQTRDFVFVGDVVQANLRAAMAEGPLNGATLNVGTGQAISVNELATTMAAIWGDGALAPVHQEGRPGEVRHSVADISQAQRLVGLAPDVSLEDGLKRTLAWYRAVTEA